MPWRHLSSSPGKGDSSLRCGNSARCLGSFVSRLGRFVAFLDIRRGETPTAFANSSPGLFQPWDTAPPQVGTLKVFGLQWNSFRVNNCNYDLPKVVSTLGYSATTSWNTESVWFAMELLQS